MMNEIFTGELRGRMGIEMPVSNLSVGIAPAVAAFAFDHGLRSYFEPTILTNVKRENPAYFEEFFGPVAQMYVVKNDDEIVEIANDSHFGLAGVVFSQNIERAKTLASRIETGAVWINSFSSTAPELPFGGVKNSGFGRELSELGIKEFVNQKLVLVKQ